jgi:hypothetical protein
VAARWSEFWPAPPSKVTGAAIAPARGSTVRASAPLPPVTFTLVTVAAGRVVAAPLTLTLTSAPAELTATSWSAASFAATDHGSRKATPSDPVAVALLDGVVAATVTSP